jgi:hypothetical protein
MTFLKTVNTQQTPNGIRYGANNRYIFPELSCYATTVPPPTPPNQQVGADNGHYARCVHTKRNEPHHGLSIIVVFLCPQYFILLNS